MTGNDRKPAPDRNEHQRRAAEALRQNLRRRKEQQRKQEKPAPDREDEPA